MTRPWPGNSMTTCVCDAALGFQLGQHGSVLPGFVA